MELCIKKSLRLFKVLSIAAFGSYLVIKLDRHERMVGRVLYISDMFCVFVMGGGGNSVPVVLLPLYMLVCACVLVSYASCL